MNDLRKVMYLTLIGFLVVTMIWLGIVYVYACGFSFECERAEAVVVRTPIPTLVAAALPAPELASDGAPVVKCQVSAFVLLGEWVDAGYSENEPFEFEDVNGQTCQATFSDVQVLFSDGNLWYSGAPACITCHHANLEVASAKLDMSSYAGILAGARREGGAAQGKDILGNGVWVDSSIYNGLLLQAGNPLAMPLGRPADVDMTSAIIFAGSPKVDP